MTFTARPTNIEDRRAAAQGVLDVLRPGGMRDALRDALGPIAPDFVELTTEVAFGDFWARPGLDPGRRELATVAVLCATGRERQLAAHLGYALNAGVTRRQLTEVLMQMSLYAGWPAASSGLAIARRVFREFDAGGVAYGLEVGGWAITVISDGTASLPAAMFVGGGLSAEMVVASAGDPVDVALNGLVLERGGRVVVVDPGLGPADRPEAMGLVPPTGGHFLTNLARAGFACEDVDLVILTHAHHDHAGAVVATGGGLTFANAQVAISATELHHWRDGGGYGEGQVPAELAHAATILGRRLAQIIAGRELWLVDDEEVVPGLRVLASPGHTPGHVSLLLDDALLVGGDMGGHQRLRLEHPGSHMAVDHDGARSVASRTRLLQRAACENLLVHGYHWPWPGLGRIQATSHGWHWIPCD